MAKSRDELTYMNMSTYSNGPFNNMNQMMPGVAPMQMQTQSMFNPNMNQATPYPGNMMNMQNENSKLLMMEKQIQRLENRVTRLEMLNNNSYGNNFNNSENGIHMI